MELQPQYQPHENLKSQVEIQSWISQNYATLEEGGYHYLGGEPNTQDPALFEQADLRVLIIRLSTYDAMDGSMTHSLLAQTIRDEAKRHGKLAFTDFAFLPPRKDYELFMKHHLPVILPVLSKRLPREFDMIMVSHSLHLEQINWPRMMIRSGLPLFKPQRMQRDDIPLILWGRLSFYL